MNKTKEFNIGDEVIFTGIHGDFRCRVEDKMPNYPLGFENEMKYLVIGDDIHSITTGKALKLPKAALFT
jgi:hypothetical protein